MDQSYFIGRVFLDLSCYTGSDKYSDGSIENEMLAIAREGKKEQELLQSDSRWPILYHFSSIRTNLLEWYPFDRQENVLEIGAGCGALSGLLCDKVGKVTSVELSKRRSEINAYRHRDKQNLQIKVGNLNDMNFEEKFDYVTLIGVLEYAGKFTDGSEPYLQFLKKIKNYLKPGGRLIIAIENKFGIKYWAGAREDHTGRLFDSLENYPSEKGIRTFGKNELMDLISAAGFDHQKYYYPYPDYKMPTAIYSDSYWPTVGQIEANSPNYDSSRIELFEERRVIDNLLLNRQFDFFANSFLVFCS